MSLNRNVVLGFPNLVDEILLSPNGGSWSTTLPLNNLKNPQIRRVARTTDDLATSTKFRVQIPKSEAGVDSSKRQIRTFALINHNMSTAANIRIVFSGSSNINNLASIDFDTGFIPVWSRSFDSLNLAWQADNFWTGRPLQEELKFFTPNFILCLPVEVYSAFVFVEIQDEENPDGYIQIGRLFLSKGFQPSINMQEGASVGYQTNTEIEMSESGSEYFRRREPYRVANFTLANQNESSAIGRIFDGQRRLGIDSEILFIYDPFDFENFQRRSFLGRLQELSPIESIFVDRYSVGFQIKEIQ